MAKTASQIAAERKLIEASRNAIHQRQMAEVGKKNAARTYAVLAKGADSTKDPVRKAELSRAAQSVVDEYVKLTSTPKKESAKTAQNMQKKKEDRSEEKKRIASLYTQKANAEKALQDYLDSEEQQKKNADMAARAMIYGVADEGGEYTPDETLSRLQDEARRAGAAVTAYENARTAERNARIAERDSVENWSDEDKAALEQYINDKQSAFVQSLNPAMTGLPADYESNPLIAKYGRQRLDQIASTYQRQQNKQKYEKAEQLGRDTTDGGFLGSILPNAQSVAANLADTLLNPLTRIAQSNVGRDDRYSTLDPYAGGQAAAYASGVRQKTAENIAGDEYDEQGNLIKEGGTGRQIGSYIYQGGMSALDSAARALISGSPTVGAGLATLGSYNQTLREASEKGATAGEAVALATVNSAIEAATEKLPLDNLFDIAKSGAKPAAQVIVNILKQAGIEILEEEAALIGTTLAEAAILREKSGYNQQITEAMANGATEKQARKQVLQSFLAEALNTAVISGIAGGFGGAGAEYIGARYVGTPEPDNWMAKTFREAMGVAQEQNPQNAQEDSTAVNTDPAQHTPQEQAVIDDYQNAVDDNLVEYIQTVKDNPGKRMPRYPLNNVSDRAAADIQRLTGIDVSGNKTQIEARTVEHILKRHGENGNADHSMRDMNDIGRIQYVIDNYDSMEHGGTTGAYRYMNADGKQVHAQTVLIKKKVNGTYFVVEAVPDTKKKTIYIVSAYMSKNGQKETASSLVGDAEAYRYTSETKAKSDTVLKDSIPQNGAEVNGNLGGTQQADTETGVQTGASNVQQQSPEGGQVKGVGAAERNFSGVAAYEDMLADDNVQRQRPGAVRDVEMPKKDSDGRRVTEFSSNVVSAGVTPDPMADAIKSLVGDKKLSFDTRTNKQSLENAADAIRERGDTAVISALHTNAENKTIVDGDIEKGLVLYAQYANDPDPKSQETASQIILDMGAIANMSGRNLQLFSLMKRMTPEGQLMTVRKNIEKSIADINKGRSAGKQIVYVPGQKNMDAAKTVAQKRKVEIDQALEQNFLDAKTDEQRKAALDDIYQNVAVQIKPTLGEAWDAWRNLAMLGNFKTHERNFVSTAAFKPYTTVKRAIGTALESVFLKQENRTKSLVGISKEAHDLVDWAKKDAKSEDVKRLLGGAGTAGDDARSAIQDYRKILPGDLDTVRKKNLQLMEAEDFVFKRSEYAVSLATFLKARGYNIKQVQAGQVPRGVLDAGRQYAVKEAQKATFNDRNRLSDAISKLNNVKNDGGGAVVNIIRKGIVPFLKTPANVVARVAEYNPVSLAKTLVTAKGDIDSGRKSAADVIDEISAGLTGSAAMVLGAALSEGLIPGVELIGAIEDEDEKREGAQEYSIRIGEKYYSVAWLAPAMIPLFMGANIRQKFNNMGDAVDGWDMVEALAKATGDALNPLLELSMLSSLSDIVQKVKYEETPGDMLMTGLINAATSYFTQGIPTVFGQIEQATETEKKSTYVNTDNKVERMVKTAVSGATKRLPGDLYQTTKRDEWGEPVKNPDDWTSRAFNAFFNPVTTSTRKTDEVTKEITRLNKSQPESVTPPTASKTISYTDRQGNAHKDVRLTEEQYQTLAETQSKTAKSILENMINSKDYAALTDAQKAEAIRTAYSYARKTGEMAAIGDQHTGYSDAWMMEMETGKEAEYIIRRVTKSDLTSTMSALNTAWDKGYDTASRSDDLKWAYDTFTSLSDDAKADARKQLSGTAAKYVESREKGVSHDGFLSAAKNVDQVKGTGTNGNVRDIDRREAIAKTSGLSQKEIDVIMRAYMTDYNPNSSKPEYSELKYDYLRQVLKLTPAQYAATYRAALDNEKDKTDYKAIMRLGFDEEKAKKIAKVYNGDKKTKQKYIDHYEKTH